MIVAIAGVAFLVAVVYVLMMVLKEDAPFEPTPVPTTSVATPPVQGPPIAAASPEASPQPTFDPNPPPIAGSLPEMLAYAPDRLSDGSLPLSDVAEYADIERWMRARGATMPTSQRDAAWQPWSREIGTLAIPNVLQIRGIDPLWEETYGFGLHDVYQVLSVGQAPDFVWIMRGDFDVDTLQAAWVESGYQAVRLDSVTVWSLFPGDAVDLSAPASRPALGNMNNVVLLDDGTLIASSHLARLEQTMDAVNDVVPSLAEHPQVQALIAPGTRPEDLVTAIIVKGALLITGPNATPGPVVAASPEAGEIPQAELVLAGLEEPQRPDDQPALSFVLAYDSADEATRAARRARIVLEHGISPVTAQPYTDRLDIVGIWVLAGGPDDVLLHMHLACTGTSDDWLTMIDERDLGFVMWPWEP